MRSVGPLIAVAVTLSLGVLTGSPVIAATNTADCDRACLAGIAESYISALLLHEPAKAPLAPGARYTENGVDLPLPDGLWRTAESVGRYRLFVADEQQGTVGFFIKAQENGAPLLVSTRLKVVGRRITEIESLASRLTATVGGGPSGLPREDQLGDEPRRQLVTTLPSAERHTREQLAAIVNGYFGGLENNTGDKPPRFAADCLRLENEPRPRAGRSQREPRPGRSTTAARKHSDSAITTRTRGFEVGASSRSTRNEDSFTQACASITTRPCAPTHSRTDTR